MKETFKTKWKPLKENLQKMGEEGGENFSDDEEDKTGNKTEKNDNKSKRKN